MPPRLLVPLIAQMNPDASTIAAGAPIEIDLAPIADGQIIKVFWRGKPIFISHRTHEGDRGGPARSTLSSLPDPQPDQDRVKAGHDQWLVVIGICTHLGCIPLAHQGEYDGWFCPCHGSQYDTSGRIRQGPAPENLVSAALRLPLRHQDPDRLTRAASRDIMSGPTSTKSSTPPAWPYVCARRRQRLRAADLRAEESGAAMARGAAADPRSRLHSSVSYPTPRNLNYWWTFGGILSFMLWLQIVTGVILAMHYTPHVDLAFNSVEHIMRDVNFGWLLRYLHANGASMFFLAVYIHMFRGMYYGSYKEPREVLWILGVIIYLLMMATGFMGYVLPWGQMSFWAATVITNLFSAIPVVGDPIVTWLWGGYRGRQSDAEPVLLAALPVAVRDRRRRRAARLGAARGRAEQSGRHRAEVGQGHGAFTPYATVKDAFVLAVFCILFAWFVFYIPNYLGHADNYIPANPAVTPPHIVPEWYYLPFYAILRSIPNKLLGVIALFGSIVILAFLPWLDTSKVRSARYRPLYRQFFWMFVIVCIGLGWLGSKPPEGSYVIASRGCSPSTTSLFFLIVLPLLGLFEKTKPLPNSISRSGARRKAKKADRRAIAVLPRRRRAAASATPSPASAQEPEQLQPPRA